MGHRNQTKPTQNWRKILADMYIVHGDKQLDNQQSVTQTLDPMAEELCQMSCNSGKKDKYHAEPSQRWLAIDRSSVFGAERPWDGLAYIGTRKCIGQEEHEQQQTRSRSKSSSLEVEWSSDV